MQIYILHLLTAIWIVEFQLLLIYNYYNYTL